MKATAKITQRNDPVFPNAVSITIDWDADVDRKNTGGWVVSRPKLVPRLVRCINAQRAHKDAQIKTDINGHTYVAWTHLVSGKRMNADLKRLGF